MLTCVLRSTPSNLQKHINVNNLTIMDNSVELIEFLKHRVAALEIEIGNSKCNIKDDIVRTFSGWYFDILSEAIKKMEVNYDIDDDYENCNCLFTVLIEDNFLTKDTALFLEINGSISIDKEYTPSSNDNPENTDYYVIDESSSSVDIESMSIFLFEIDYTSVLDKNEIDEIERLVRRVVYRNF